MCISCTPRRQWDDDEIGDDDHTPDDDDDYTPDDVLRCVAELKKQHNGKCQLWAEAFNFLVTDIVEFNLAMDGCAAVVKASVFCILLINNSKEGYISKLTLNFDEQTCSIEEHVDGDREVVSLPAHA